MSDLRKRKKSGRSKKRRDGFLSGFFQPGTGGEELISDAFLDELLRGREEIEVTEEDPGPDEIELFGDEEGREDAELSGAEGAEEEPEREPAGTERKAAPSGKKRKKRPDGGRKRRKKKKKRSLLEYADEEFDPDEPPVPERKRKGLFRFGKRREEAGAASEQEEPEPGDEPVAAPEPVSEGKEEGGKAAERAERGFGAASRRYEELKRSLASSSDTGTGAAEESEEAPEAEDASDAAEAPAKEPADAPDGEEEEGSGNTEKEQVPGSAGDEVPDAAKEEEKEEDAAPEPGQGNETPPADGTDAEPDGERIRLFEEEASEDDGEIRLFDHDGYERETGRKKRGRDTRKAEIRTGTGSTAVVNVRATEGLRAAERERAERREKERAERALREEERAGRRRKLNRSLRSAAGTILLGGTITIAVLLALYYGFLLSSVEVTGNKRYSRNYIVELSGLKLKQHMLTVDLDEVRRNIQDDPYLQVSSVNYLFPSRIRIAVTERQAIAGIEGLDYNVIIDDQGYVLEMGMGIDLTGMIIVTGANMTGFRVGERLGEGNDFSTATLISIFRAIEENDLLGSIRAIDLSTPLAITVTAVNGLKVFVGQSTDLDGKFASLKKELPAFLRQNINWGMLYLSAKGGTVYSPREISQILSQEVTQTEQGDSGYTGMIGSGAPSVRYGGAAGGSQQTGGASVPSQDFNPGAEDDFQG